MRADLLIIGGGVAGLACALEADHLRVIVVNDTPPASDVASAWAQGGMAAALAEDDAPALHAADTLMVGAGIGDARIVHELTADAPAAIDLLERLGIVFDRGSDGAIALGLEAAHSRRRIVHAADHTGATVVRGMLAALALRPNITLLTGLRAIGLDQADDGRVTGAVFLDAGGRSLGIAARSVVLATGGYGGIYAQTTTPRATLGAGMMLAKRAGATLADLEFVQFHPTALATDSDPMALISEAVRGEGARLIDGHGERFVDELAPRDVVARAIFAVQTRGGAAFLDCRAALGESFVRRFPTINARCLVAGIDPAYAPIPVTPAAHYTIGGIATDSRGRTGVPGLWACGEVAATGLHGANRLASNSLVEGIVFGARAAYDIVANLPAEPPAAVRAVATPMYRVADLAAELAPLRAMMATYVGVIRDDAGLRRALAICDELAARPGARDVRVRDAIALAGEVARAALARRESRGAHFRRDFPQTDVRLASRSFVSSATAVASSA